MRRESQGRKTYVANDNEKTNFSRNVWKENNMCIYNKSKDQSRGIKREIEQGLQTFKYKRKWESIDGTWANLGWFQLVTCLCMLFIFNATCKLLNAFGFALNNFYFVFVSIIFVDGFFVVVFFVYFSYLQWVTLKDYTIFRASTRRWTLELVWRLILGKFGNLLPFFCTHCGQCVV